MIRGLGTDIIEIERVRAVATGTVGERFVERLLTVAEAAIIGESLSPENARAMQFLAGRFAAKEAVAKALGCGIGASLSFLHIEILHDGAGKPQCKLAAETPVIQSLPDGWQIHVSISHSRDYATAVAILEVPVGALDVSEKGRD